jgi:uncharacterized protein
MRLYSGKVPTIAGEIVRALTEAGDIETGKFHEVDLDVQAVLNNYLAIEREATDKAKEMIDARGLPPGEFSRMKKLAAEQKGIKVGDEILDHLLDQIVEILMHSNNVDEVFAEDVVMRKRMVPILKRHMAVDEEIDQEVRGHMKNMAEGTRTWEIEYARIKDEIKRRKGV